MGVVGRTPPRRRSALEALISLGIPPATSSASRACSRQALRSRARPRSLLRSARGSHLHVGELGLALVDGHRGVRTCVGIHADHHLHLCLLDRVGWNRGGHPDRDGLLGPLLSHTSTRSRRTSDSFESQSTGDGRQLESRPARDLRRYGSPATSGWTLNQADMAPPLLTPDELDGLPKLGCRHASERVSDTRASRIDDHEVAPLPPGTS